ncbi:mucin-17-like [Seriola aureovittata]|uniref:mucin-17-like n=1 Tax=Seriola aureovittata TaxID=2871759 RepID=UPI0024BD8466|nr:mucin-17-like [Seriola aureovittata]
MVLSCVLQQAGSEGELCKADSLGSAGSSSTLASSVIEVDAERPELGLTQQLRPNHEEEEDEEEELTPLSHPPTLSITEEILEFINQSRAREGLTSIHTDATEKVNQSKGSQSPTNQSNFTCPLPPVVCSSSPEQRPAKQQEQERSEMEDDGTLQSQTSNSDKENEATNEVKEIPDATSHVEKGVELDAETQGEGVDKEKEDKKTREEGEGQCIILAATSDHPSISAEEERENSREEASNEATTSSPNPDLSHHPIQRCQPPTRGSHLTKRDKKIIEKIRSYYEAAAEADEDDVEEENEQGEGVASRRRNSFSQIPSGLVKESVSRFDVGGHQGETESTQSKYETTEAIDRENDREAEPCSPTGPISSPTPLSAYAENDRQADKPISSLDFDAEGPIKTPMLTVIQDKETPNQVGLNLQLNQNRPVGERTEIQDNNGKVCTGLLEEGLDDRQDGNSNVVPTGEQGGHLLQAVGSSNTKQYKCRDETTKTCVMKGVMKSDERNQWDPAEPKRSQKEPSTPLTPTEQCQKTETTSHSTWTVTKHRDLAKTSLEDLTSQIKVGRWSRHSRIVTANRALFEGMGSDVTSVGLFESSPVVDPVLIENSERILSKVQTLARMYSAKASTMKIPLHQKRASAVQNQSWGSGRLSGHSTLTLTQVPSQTQQQTPSKNWQQTQYQMGINNSDTHTGSKTGTQTHIKTKVQSQTQTQTKQQLQIQTKSQISSQAQTHYQRQYQTQTMSWEYQRIQEEGMINRAESLTVDFQRSVMPPCEPLLFGHVFVKEQLTSACHHQMNDFTLSRPRDFISALTKERDSVVGCRSGDKSQTSSQSPRENPVTSQRDQSSNQAQDNSYDPGRTSSDRCMASTSARSHLSAQPEDESYSSCCSATNTPSTPTMTLDCGVTKLSSTCFAGKDEALHQNREVYTDTEETEKKGGSQQSAAHPVSSVREDSTSANIITQPAHKYKQDIPAAQYIQNKHVPDTDNIVPGAHAEPEHLVCTKNLDGELVLTLAKKDELRSDQTKLNETKCDLNSPSQTRMIVQGSAVIFSEEPPFHRSSRDLVIPPSPSQPLHLTFDPFQVNLTSEDHKARERAALSPGPSPNPTQPQSQSAQSGDCLPTFISQRLPEIPTTTGKQALSNTLNLNYTTPYECREPDQQDSGSPNNLPIFGLLSDHHPPSRLSMETASLGEPPNPAIATHSQDTEPTSAPSAFTPSLRHHSRSPVRAPPASSPLPLSPSSVRVPPCSSLFTAVPASSLTPGSSEGFTSPNTGSRAVPSSSPTPSAGMTAPPASSPTPSSVSGRSLSVRAGVPSSPTPSSSPRSSPITSSSAFTRSLAASCISQSISQSMAKKSTAQQQAPSINPVNQSPSSTPSFPSSHLQRHSPSPKLPPSQQSPSTPAYVQMGYIKDGHQHPRCPPSFLLSSCPSPSLLQLTTPSLSHCSPSPSMSLAHHQPSHSPSASSRPSFLHSSQNANNNNNNNFSLAGLPTVVSSGSNISSCSINGAVNNGGWSGSPQKTPLANGSTNATVMQQTHDPLWLGSHNRVARPFSASEPNSRVQSPTPSPTPASFARLCSPPPQHKFSTPMANKPPHPPSTRAGGASFHNPLGLTLELPRASSASSALVQSSSCLSPRILSPPPIGVSVNVWTNNVATPQPRNPRLASSSPLSPFFSTSGSATFPTSSSTSVQLHSSRASSPSRPCPPAVQTLHRSFSSNLADRPPSPAWSNPSGLRCSWAESSHRSLCFSGSGRGSFDQQESYPTSPLSGWSSCNTSQSCLSPRPGLQSSLSASRLTPTKGTLGGQHFTSVPWPDVRELSNKYNGADCLDTIGTSTIIATSPSLSSLSQSFLSSPAPSDSQTEWGDPELEEGSCRSQLICAYVAHPFHEQNLPSCLALSSSGTTSPPNNYPSEVKPHPQAQTTTRTSPVPPVPFPVPSNSSPLPFVHSSPTKPGNQKTSYATTVNLQIAGSGRITSFSTAQVSLTQTLQGGAGAGGPGQGHMVRRVSINGLSHLPPPLPQNCNRL